MARECTLLDLNPFNLLRLVLEPRICSTLVNIVSAAHEKNILMLVIGMFYMSIKKSWLTVLLKSSVLLLSSCYLFY